jgi:Flp pilus assembly protein TadG
MPSFSLLGRGSTEPSAQRESERGQLLVIFALAMVAIIGMVGLIIDGGDTSLQRRDQQNVADAAAMAAGYALVNGMDVDAAAQSVAAANGYVNGSDSTTVTVANLPDRITVSVSRPHRNYFSGLLGFASWDVSTTASVVAGIPGIAAGTMPILVNQAAFDPLLNPEDITDPDNPVSFGEPPAGSSDIPLGTDHFNWTVFCAASSATCNANSDVVEDWIDEDGVSAEVSAAWQIAPLNAGSHTTLYDSMASVVGEAFPVAVVDDTGTLVGWAYFHLTGSVGGSTKSISGWFEIPYTAPEVGVTIHGVGSGGPFGGYSVELID